MTIRRSESGLRCSWCLDEQHVAPEEGESHGICTEHEVELLSNLRRLRPGDKVIRQIDATGASGLYLASYDPDAGDPSVAYPTGESTWTHNPVLAMRFATFAAAMACWRQPSARTPARPDGKPNRPLTAFTITIEDAP